MKTVCGLAIHKDIILMCKLKGNGEKIIREFTSLTIDNA
jgi:hypothetical protein